MIVLSAIAIYTAAWLILFSTFRKRQTPSAVFRYVLPLAIAAHAWTASESVITPQGYQLGFFQVAPVFFIAMNVIVALGSLRKQIENLFLILIPLTCFSLFSAITIYTREPIASIDAQLAGHIVLSIVAYSLLTLATLQAILLNYQNNQLKQHHAKAVIGIFPPLQTMESLMFYMVWAGFILLSLSIPTGLVNISDIFEQQLSHKTVFSVLSWLIYATLLIGRQTFGWRGKVAIRWVIAGFVMLMLAYFGSKFVIEFILS